jgi:pyruvate formate lyase activating enzyme
MTNGIIFSIEEFSTFNGPGIRMTFFLKGCPLRCVWCHNPEGQEFDSQIVRSPNGCIRCGKCLEAGKTVNGYKSLVKESISVCPRGLVRICGEEKSSEEILEITKKNARILNASGGGVTFSGGEPLSQPDFLLDCLKKLKGVTNRAVQTCGYSKEDVFISIINECDYMLFDIKIIDSIQHTLYTGKNNDLIMKNFDTLVKSGKEFTVRIPLIPTITDTMENITGIAELLKGYNIRKADLLPYNKMAGGKYALTGREYSPMFDESAEPATHIDIFSQYGIEVNVL